MSIQNALKQLFELRAVLDRLQENDLTIQESMSHDLDEAIRLTNLCITELTQDTYPGRAEAEEDEED